MSEWPEFGERLRVLLRERGYHNPLAFALDKQYVPNYVYRWLKGAMPERKNLERLARDLGVSPKWLMFGDDNGSPVTPGNGRSRGRGVLVFLLASAIWAASPQEKAHAMVDNQLSPCILSAVAIRLLRRLRAAMVPSTLHWQPAAT